MSGMGMDYFNQAQAGVTQSIANAGKVVPLAAVSFAYSYVEDALPSDGSTTSRVIASLGQAFRTLLLVTIAK